MDSEYSDQTWRMSRLNEAHMSFCCFCCAGTFGLCLYIVCHGFLAPPLGVSGRLCSVIVAYTGHCL